MNGKIKIENLLKGKNPLPDYMLLIVSQIKIWYADAVYSPDEAEVILNNINQTIDELKFTVRNDVKSGNIINRTLDYKGLDSILTVYSLTGQTPVLSICFEKTTEKPTDIFQFF